MRIVLAEDQPLILTSLTILLSGESDVEVVATASDGTEALERVAEFVPDLAVLDIRMKPMDGLEAAKQLSTDYPDIPVVLLTTFDNAEYYKKALALGVSGFLLKDVEPEIFVSALKAVAGGLLVYHKGVRPHLKPSLPLSDPASLGAAYSLNEKERKIISYIVDGLSNKEISFLEKCSEGSVKNRVSAILGKMSLQARTQIAVTALKEGLV